MRYRSNKRQFILDTMDTRDNSRMRLIRMHGLPGSTCKLRICRQITQQMRSSGYPTKNNPKTKQHHKIYIIQLTLLFFVNPVRCGPAGAIIGKDV